MCFSDQDASYERSEVVVRSRICRSRSEMRWDADVDGCGSYLNRGWSYQVERVALRVIK